MKSILSNVLFFTVGAAIGSAVTWKIVKTKYEQISRAEIESVRELYAKEEASHEEAEDSEEDDFT